MNFNKSHRTWIRDELISNLIKTHKLIKLKNPTEFIKSKTIEIKQMSHEEAFMLTCCYKVKIILQIHNNESEPLDEHIVHLVVKVRIDNFCGVIDFISCLKMFKASQRFFFILVVFYKWKGINCPINTVETKKKNLKSISIITY